MIKKTLNIIHGISLSISPAITEVMIQPGKEYKIEFNISNQGEDTVISPNITKFIAKDNFGNPEITNEKAPSWVKYSTEPIEIKSNKSTTYFVVISPSVAIPENDHYLSLTLTTPKETDQKEENSLSHTIQIASNILITISKDGMPDKHAEIVGFEAPKLIDSLFGRINYSVIIKNEGKTVFKPIGKIIVDDNEILHLAPQNIIADSTRNILCIEGENIKPCFIKNNLKVGKISSILEFNANDDPKIYKKEIFTYSYPFSLILLATALIFITILLTKGRKKMHSSDRGRQFIKK